MGVESVVCGSEARKASIGSGATADQPGRTSKVVSAASRDQSTLACRDVSHPLHVRHRNEWHCLTCTDGWRVQRLTKTTTCSEAPVPPGNGAPIRVPHGDAKHKYSQKRPRREPHKKHGQRSCEILAIA